MTTTSETPRNVFIGVDIQNDFVDGSLAVNGGADVVAPANAVAEAVRESNGTVAWTRDWHPASTPHFDSWPVHCVAESEGAAFREGLDIKPTDTIISKGMEQTDGYSGWEGIDLEDRAVTLETLIAPEKNEQVRVFIGGLATDYCVKATTLDVAEHFADNKRVSTYLIRDAIRAVELQQGDEQAALNAIADAKVEAISSKEAIAMIAEMF